MRIHLVVNVSQIVQYRKQVEEQKIKKIKLVKVEGVEEQEVKKNLDKRKIQEVMKYLVQWKGFMAKHNTQKKKENLENIKKIVTKFEGKINTEDGRKSQIWLRKITLGRGGYQTNTQQRYCIDEMIESLKLSI